MSFDYLKNVVYPETEPINGRGNEKFLILGRNQKYWKIKWILKNLLPYFMRTPYLIGFANEHIGVGIKGYMMRWLFFKIRIRKFSGNIYQLQRVDNENSAENITFDPNTFFPYQYTFVRKEKGGYEVRFLGFEVFGHEWGYDG